MINVLKLNKISNKIYDVFDSNYQVTDACDNPDLILVRSAQMADYPVNKNLLAIGRAGAGVNNIPHADYIKKGVVVFNTPGANANAVKELVICALLTATRNVYEGITWAESLKGEDDAKKIIEKGKSQFTGHEISGKTLGVIGMGAIGRLVADSACALGMNVIGYDPYLNKALIKEPVKTVDNIDDIYKNSDFITIHIPFTPETNGFINKSTIAKMKDGAIIINCARGELVDNKAVIDALNSGKLYKYFTDFPTAEVLDIKNIVATPHIGASTPEAEDNCAVMASTELKDFVENGNIKNSVNYPSIYKERNGHRITVLCDGNPDTLKNVKILLSNANISGDVVNATRGDAGYIVCDTNCQTGNIESALTAISGVYKVRIID